VSGVVEIVAAFGDHISAHAVLNIMSARCRSAGLFCFRGALESVPAEPVIASVS